MKAPRSITQHVYNEIRSELIRCDLRPGSRLRTSNLSTRFGVSLSAVREALSRLVSESLVESDPQRGFRAAPVSRQGLLDLTEASLGIEAMCIRSALSVGDRVWEERLIAATKVVNNAPPSRISKSGKVSSYFADAHQNYHETLISACTNNRILQLRKLLGDESERYRQFCIPLTPNIDELRKGYDEITAAACARDADTTIALVSAQFHRNVAYFAEALEKAEAAGALNGG